MAEAENLPGLEILVNLMARSPWAGRVLSGRVRSRDTGRRGDERRLAGRLWLAPQGCYRAELEDEDGEPEIMMSDGSSVWSLWGGEAHQFDPAGTTMPFSYLLHPSWLQAEYRLRVEGRRRHTGRLCYLLTGTAITESPSFLARYDASVEALVDAELGLLLSYRIVAAGRSTEHAEFVDLEERATLDADFFRPAGDIRIVDERETVPTGAAPATKVADEQYPQALHPDLLSWLGSQPQSLVISGVLRERVDYAGFAAGSEGQQAGGESKLGRLAEKLQAIRPPGDISGRIWLDPPDRYRIDVIEGRISGPQSLICDGRDLWQVFNNEVLRGIPAPLPLGIARLADPSWVLHGYRLISLDEDQYRGRPAHKITAEPLLDRYKSARSVFSRGAIFPCDQIELLVDGITHFCLSARWYWQRSVICMTDLLEPNLEVDPAVFTYSPPPGSPVRSGGPSGPFTLHDIADVAVSSVNALADVIRRLGAGD